MTQLSLRTDGRADHEARPLTLTLDFTMHAEGSVLVECGNTKVICTASVEDDVPPFLKGKDKKPKHGWVTAEYGMLPRSTGTRRKRETGKVDGRTQEIQRLIGRSLRSVTDLHTLTPYTLRLDCDVIQADGGTRTAAIFRSLCRAHPCVAQALLRRQAQTLSREAAPRRGQRGAGEEPNAARPQVR